MLFYLIFFCFVDVAVEQLEQTYKKCELVDQIMIHADSSMSQVMAEVVPRNNESEVCVSTFIIHTHARNLNNWFEYLLLFEVLLLFTHYYVDVFFVEIIPGTNASCSATNRQLSRPSEDRNGEWQTCMKCVRVDARVHAWRVSCACLCSFVRMHWYIESIGYPS